jgi:putative oxidoreductase
LSAVSWPFGAGSTLSAAFPITFSNSTRSLWSGHPSSTSGRHHLDARGRPWFQVLFFKFTGAEESVYIFSAVGRFLNLAGVEPWGRIGSGVLELIASLLLVVPATASIGAILTMGVMAGAILSHLVILGIDVRGDGGLLFGLALIAFVASAIVLALRRAQIPVVGRFFELA